LRKGTQGRASERGKKKGEVGFIPVDEPRFPACEREVSKELALPLAATDRKGCEGFFGWGDRRMSKKGKKTKTN